MSDAASPNSGARCAAPTAGHALRLMVKPIQRFPQFILLLQVPQPACRPTAGFPCRRWPRRVCSWAGDMPGGVGWEAWLCPSTQSPHLGCREVADPGPRFLAPRVEPIQWTVSFPPGGNLVTGQTVTYEQWGAHGTSALRAPGRAERPCEGFGLGAPGFMREVSSSLWAPRAWDSPPDCRGSEVESSRAPAVLSSLSSEWTAAGGGFGLPAHSPSVSQGWVYPVM